MLKRAFFFVSNPVLIFSKLGYPVLMKNSISSKPNWIIFKVFASTVEKFVSVKNGSLMLLVSIKFFDAGSNKITSLLNENNFKITENELGEIFDLLPQKLGQLPNTFLNYKIMTNQ